MMPALSLHNFLSWMAQISVIVLVGTLLPRLFSIRHPQSHLLYSRLLLAMCMFVPFLQPWQNIVVRDSANGQSYFPVLAIAPAILQLDPSIPLERVIFYALFAGIFLNFVGSLRACARFAATGWPRYHCSLSRTRLFSPKSS